MKKTKVYGTESAMAAAYQVLAYAAANNVPFDVARETLKKREHQEKLGPLMKHLVATTNEDTGPRFRNMVPDDPSSVRQFLDYVLTSQEAGSLAQTRPNVVAFVATVQYVFKEHGFA